MQVCMVRMCTVLPSVVCGQLVCGCNCPQVCCALSSSLGHVKYPRYYMFIFVLGRRFPASVCKFPPGRLVLGWVLSLSAQEANPHTAEVFEQRLAQLCLWGISIFVHLLAWAAALLLTQVFGMDAYLKKDFKRRFSSLYLNVPAAHFNVLWECQDSALQHYEEFSCDLLVGRVKPSARVYKRKFYLLF